MQSSNFIGLADGRQTVVKSFASNADIQKYLKDAFYISSAMVKRSNFATAFKGRTVEQTAQNIWNFLKNNIEYEIDPDDWQLLRLAPRFVKDGKGDCKSYSLFAASVLSALGLPVNFVFTNYVSKAGKLPNPQNVPTHVYVTTRDQHGRRIIIDGVYNYFNREKPYYFKNEVPMKIAVLSGLDKNEAYRQAGRQAEGGDALRVTPTKENEYKARFIKQNIKFMLNSQDAATRQRGQMLLQKCCPTNTAINGKFWDGFKKVTLSGARGAFLGLVKLNARGLATKLNALVKTPAGTANLQKKWKQLGGSYAAIQKAIKVGAPKKPLLGMKVNGIAEPVTLTALLATAGAIIAVIAPLLKNIKLGKDDEGMDSLLAESRANGGDLTTLPPADNVSDEQHEKSGGSDTIFGIDKNLLIFGAVGAGVLVLSKK